MYTVHYQIRNPYAADVIVWDAIKGQMVQSKGNPLLYKATTDTE